MNTTKSGTLGIDLPRNIRYLASLISRKPAAFSSEWAASPDEAFSLYTRTSTLNLFLSTSEILEELEWPFPAYLDLRREERSGSVQALGSCLELVGSLLRDGLTLTGSVTINFFDKDDVKRQQNLSSLMRYLFWRHSRQVFRFWEGVPELSDKQAVVREIRLSYKHSLWGACIQRTFGLTDHLMRDCLKTTNLSKSVQTIRSAFRAAGVFPKDLKPGYAIGRPDPAKANALARTLDEDLRLPGILLSSFIEFANTYYADSRTVPSDGTQCLNRHTVMHGASDCETPENAVRMLTFFDLGLRIAPVLRVLIHGPKTCLTPRTAYQLTGQ